MSTRRYASRRSLLKILGSGGAVVLGVGTASADHGEDHPDPTFFARLSDNPSIPGHDKVRSKGRGRLDLRGESGTNGTVLHYELHLANVEQRVLAAHIHGDGRADGPIWVTLCEDGACAVGTVRGTITDKDVTDAVGSVGNLIWDELVEGNGVVNVNSEFSPGGEIAGIVRPRPVGGWIKV